MRAKPDARHKRWGIRHLGLPWRAELALALHRTGKTDRALALARDQWTTTHGPGATPRVGAIASRTLGLIEPDPDLARQRLHESVLLLEGGPAQLELAYSLVALGSHLRRRKHRKEAVEILSRGMTLAAGCNATALAENARGELIITGAKPRRHALSGADALTPSERRVAHMAAHGQTHRQIAQQLFLSTRTVESHLAHCYQKLNITTRDQLAANLAR